MMTEKDKLAAWELLRRRYDEDARSVCLETDERLAEYLDGLCHEPTVHSGWELLCGARFLRFLKSYDFDTKKVRRFIRLREGTWEKVEEAGCWRHVGGGLSQPGAAGATFYRWQPFQVFVLALVFGFFVYKGASGKERGARSEEDYVRLCTDFTFFAPRKTDKTGLSAYIQLLFFLFEDYNAEIYCCANSSNQSKLLFKRTCEMLRQLDDGKRLRITQSVADWRDAFKQVRNSLIQPLSSGGKTKDGMFAQLCCADEYGSAGYCNGKNDMQRLVDVICSSMGPRKSPLLFTTTTAGRVKSGPFMEKLDALHRMLLDELKPAAKQEASGKEQEAGGIVSGDRVQCLLLEPDDWEKTDEELLLTSSDVWRKVNPMLGVIVREQFYADAASKSRSDGDTGEFLSKLVNVYQTESVKEWIKPDEIRALQQDRRIDDCLADDGWIVFAGLDFSRGDDLNGVSYLAYNTDTDMFFADMDSYVSEKAVNESPIRELYLKWARDGWLHIVPGQTFDPALPVCRIVVLNGKGLDFYGFGYDPYNAKNVVNALTEWLFSNGIDPQRIIKPVRQNFATYNPAVMEFDYMVRRSSDDGAGHQIPQPMIHFSKNPLWPWEFGNVMLSESTDGMENLKPVKRNSSPSCKVDNVQMLLNALILYDQVQAQIG